MVPSVISLGCAAYVWLLAALFLECRRALGDPERRAWGAAVAGALLPGRARDNARWLAYSLVPLGGVGVFLGLSAMTVSHLSAEGLLLPWLPQIRAALLGIAALWSMGLAIGMMRHTPSIPRRLMAVSAMAIAVAGIITPWLFLFFLW